MINCIVCKQDKNDDEYNWRNKASRLRKNYCRTCDREIKKRHYDNNRAKVIAQVRARSVAALERFQQWKITLSCSICSESDPCCLDFHHTDPTQKDFEIGTAAQSASWNTLMEEVKKCIVVCKNCHCKIHKYGLACVKEQRG